jgi:hypothetical protein
MKFLLPHVENRQHISLKLLDMFAQVPPQGSLHMPHYHHTQEIGMKTTCAHGAACPCDVSAGAGWGMGGANPVLLMGIGVGG